MPLIVGAFVAGFLMFLAPCTLPIVPGYLAFIAAGRGVMRNAFAFVLGFSVLFILLGASAGLFGLVVGAWRYEIARLGGVILILFGLTMLGTLRLPFISAEHHVRLPKFLTLGTMSSSFLIGALFALGWSPCIGPILGSVLFLASASATALSGAILLGVFSLGLGLPFLLTALLLEKAQSWAVKTAAVAHYVSYVGGVLLIGIGLLMLFNMTGLLVSWGYGALDMFGYDRLLNYL